MITFTIVNDKLTGLQVRFGDMVLDPVESPGRWQDSASLLSRWGLNYCPQCRAQWNEIFRHQVALDKSVVVVGAYACRACGKICARTNRRKVVQWWDNFNDDSLHAHLSSVVAYPDNLWRTCLDSQPDVCVHENFLGINFTYSCLVGLAPFGLDILASMFETGTCMVGKMLSAVGLAGPTGWDEPWPHRTAFQDNWLVIDTAANLPSTKDFEGHRKAGELLRWGPDARHHPRYASVEGAKVILEQIKARPPATAEFLRVLARLGWQNKFKSEEWAKVVAQSIAPFGEPSAVLKPRKTLKARQ